MIPYYPYCMMNLRKIIYKNTLHICRIATFVSARSIPHIMVVFLEENSLGIFPVASRCSPEFSAVIDLKCSRKKFIITPSFLFAKLYSIISKTVYVSFGINA